MRRAARALGHPERAAPTFHVAGTNGKGSTAAMLAAMLTAAGRRVGLYTSPHLVSFRERIVIGGAPITEAAVVAGVARIRDRLGPTMDLTCFEVMTLLAWEAFRAGGVDVVVLEVGLGGRLDATNLVTPEVAIVTNVAVDHEAYLGRDVATIAHEKAGIIKAGVPVVSGASGDAADVIAARAAALASPLEVLDRDFALAPDGSGALAYRSGERDDRAAHARPRRRASTSERGPRRARARARPDAHAAGRRHRRRPRRRTLAGAPPGSVP